MYQLVYSSIANRLVSKNDLSKLLLLSQVNNSKNGVTGCIVYHRNEFIHLLEGDKDVILKLYSRIVEDHRHRHVTLLYKQESGNRFFKESFIAAEIISLEHIPDGMALIPTDELLMMRKKMTGSSVAVKLFGHVVQQLLMEKLLLSATEQ